MCLVLCTCICNPKADEWANRIEQLPETHDLSTNLWWGKLSDVDRTRNCSCQHGLLIMSIHTQGNALTKTDDQSTSQESTNISTRAEGLNEGRHNNQSTSNSHTGFSTKEIGNWTSKEETSHDGTHSICCVDSTYHVCVWTVKVLHPILWSLDRVVDWCIISIENHTTRCHEWGIPENVRQLDDLICASLPIEHSLWRRHVEELIEDQTWKTERLCSNHIPRLLDCHVAFPMLHIMGRLESFLGSAQQHWWCCRFTFNGGNNVPEFVVLSRCWGGCSIPRKWASRVWSFGNRMNTEPAWWGPVRSYCSEWWRSFASAIFHQSKMSRSKS